MGVIVRCALWSEAHRLFRDAFCHLHHDCHVARVLSHRFCARVALFISAETAPPARGHCALPAMRGALRAAALPALLLLLALPTPSRGHGQITWPPSTRHGGNIHAGADCARGECFWFSNNVEIPGPTTLPASMRSMEPEVEGGKRDVWRTHPWRAPGTAPVYGSGCGVAGGHPTHEYANGGVPPVGVRLGFDGAFLPKSAPARWLRGGVAEVAWAMSANHAGGYAYRLCKADNPGGLTESCFQKGHLTFAKASASAASSFATFPDGERKPMPTSSPEFRRDVFVVSGASPKNAEWVRVPVPTCRECASAYDRCGAPLLPTPGLDYGSQWNVQVNCYAACAGSASSRVTGSCPDETQFFFGNETETEPLRYSGYGKNIWEWSILDTVEVPADLEPGEYVLSWRWDCEQSAQVWQNCADVEIVASANQTRWDVASAAAIAEVPAVARGGGDALLFANERCMDLLALCRTEEGRGTEACGQDRIDATCAVASAAAAKTRMRRGFVLLACFARFVFYLVY